MSDVPQKGKMKLYSRMAPPLTAGSYELDIAQMVDTDPTLPETRHFEITGPRFRLAAKDLHSVFPPANAQGAFDLRLPIAVFGRRTLPWERNPEGGLETSETPWLALLVFEEGEVSILRNIPVSQAVQDPRSELTFVASSAADAAAQPVCDAVEIPGELLDKVLPTREELEFLVHVRQVNTEDKELAGQDLDGWFSVAFANRLPTPGLKHVACLVSLEGRLHLLPEDPPVLKEPKGPGPLFPYDRVADRIAPHQSVTIASGLTTHPGGSVETPKADEDGNPWLINQQNQLAFQLDVGAKSGAGTGFGDLARTFPAVPARFILLSHWTFVCQDEGGDFEALMQDLDVGMLGQNHASITDTGHLPMASQTREGEETTVWYRGPLVPAEVDRQNDGPYHSADQARRLTPETGMEDLSYAAAFELGRLLAISDARFAVELLRWRRGGHRRHHRVKLHEILRLVAPFWPLDKLHEKLTAVVGLEELINIHDPLLADQIAPRIDPTGLTQLQGKLAAFDVSKVASAWNISEDVAESFFKPSLLGNLSQAGSTPALESDLDAIANDLEEHVGHLKNTRASMFENFITQLSRG